jgi:hypothetical protein
VVVRYIWSTPPNASNVTLEAYYLDDIRTVFDKSDAEIFIIEMIDYIRANEAHLWKWKKNKKYIFWVPMFIESVGADLVTKH